MVPDLCLMTTDVNQSDIKLIANKPSKYKGTLNT